MSGEDEAFELNRLEDEFRKTPYEFDASPVWLNLYQGKVHELLDRAQQSIPRQVRLKMAKEAIRGLRCGAKARWGDPMPSQCRDCPVSSSLTQYLPAKKGRLELRVRASREDGRAKADPTARATETRLRMRLIREKAKKGVAGLIGACIAVVVLGAFALTLCYLSDTDSSTFFVMSYVTAAVFAELALAAAILERASRARHKAERNGARNRAQRASLGEEDDVSLTWRGTSWP